MSETPIQRFVAAALAHWSPKNREELHSEIMNCLDDDEVADAMAKYATLLTKNRHRSFENMVCCLCAFMTISRRQPQNLEPSRN